MSTVPRSPGEVLDDLPAHLLRESSPPKRRGDIKCRVCRRWITITPDGRELGHCRWKGRSYGVADGRCPHRPKSVEPSGAAAERHGDRDVLRDESGRFVGLR